MKITHLMALVVLCASAQVMHAQQQASDKIRIVRPGTTRSIVIEEAATLSSSQSFVLPSAVGAVGNFLGVSSASGSTTTLSWQAVTASGVERSDRSVDNDSTTQLIVSVEANKAYRVAGFLHMNMTTGAANDNISPTLYGPANTSYVNYGIRCADCGAGTTGSPAFATGTTNATIATAINPDGATDTRGSARAYIIEGLVVTGSSSGSVWVTLGANSKIRLNSYIILTEIE